MRHARVRRRPAEYTLRNIDGKRFVGRFLPLNAIRHILLNKLIRFPQQTCAQMTSWLATLDGSFFFFFLILHLLTKSYPA